MILLLKSNWERHVEMREPEIMNFRMEFIFLKMYVVDLKLFTDFM